MMRDNGDQYDYCRSGHAIFWRRDSLVVFGKALAKLVEALQKWMPAAYQQRQRLVNPGTADLRFKFVLEDLI